MFLGGYAGEIQMTTMEAPATKLTSPMMAFSTPTDDALELLAEYSPATGLGPMPVIKLPGVGMTITYARRSSSKLDEGGSRKRQEAEQDDICEKNDLPSIVERFYDDGMTGTVTTRPGYAAMQAFGDQWQGCNIVLELVDRAVRSGEVGFDFGHFVVRNNIRLFDKDGEVTPTRLLAKCAEAAGVHALIVERNAVARDLAIRSGVFFPEAPFGYMKPRRGTIVPHPEEAPIAKEMFRMRAEGNTYGQIARWLTEKGVPTRRNKPEWSISAVNNLLRNFVFIGLTVNTVKKTGERFVVETPRTQIIDLDVFRAVQSMRTREKRGKYKTSGHRTLLATKALCPGGSPLTRQSYLGADVTLQCKRIKCSCGGVHDISRAAIERAALDSLKGLIVSTGHEQGFLDELRSIQSRQDAAEKAVRSNLRTQINAEQMMLDRAIEQAYRLNMMEEMAPRISEGKAMVAKLREREAMTVPPGYRAKLIGELKSVAGSIDFLMDNTPLRRADSESEAVIQAISSVISSVRIEPLGGHAIRQTTVLDFNQPGGEADPGLVRSVTREFVEPVLRAAERKAAVLADAMDTASFRLSDSEYQAALALDYVKAHFSHLDDVHRRAGMDALFLVSCVGAEMKQTLKSHGVGPKTDFSNALGIARRFEGSAELTDYFKTLRPGVDGGRSLERSITGPKGELRQALEDIKHPILMHPLCVVGERGAISDAEWTAILEQMTGRKQFDSLARISMARKELDAYFAVVRMRGCWLDVVDATQVSKVGRHMNELMDRGDLARICRILLEVEGLWTRDEGVPFPQIARTARRAKKSGNEGEEKS